MSPIKNLPDQDTRSMHKHNNRTQSLEIIIQHSVNITHDDSSSYLLIKPSFTELIHKSEGEKLSPHTHINRSFTFPTVHTPINLHNTSTKKLISGIDNTQYILDKPHQPTFPPKSEESHITTQQYYSSGTRNTRQSRPKPKNQ